jgi:hypothetical protein
VRDERTATDRAEGFELPVIATRLAALLNSSDRKIAPTGKIINA